MLQSSKTTHTWGVTISQLRRVLCPIDTLGPVQHAPTSRINVISPSPIPIKRTCKMSHTAYSRDGNVITAQVSKLLMGLSYIYWCSGRDVWQFDLARGLFCMPNTWKSAKHIPCVVFLVRFTMLQCQSFSKHGIIL